MMNLPLREVARQAGLALMAEERDRLRPEGSMCPPPRKPVEAIKELPFEIRRYIRVAATCVAEGCQTSALTSPDMVMLNALTRLADELYERLRERGFEFSRGSIQAYSRQAFLEAKQWYAEERGEQQRRRARRRKA